MNKNALLKHLATDALSDAAREFVLKAGSAAVPTLMQVLRDEDQWGEDEDADGSAALHAAALLGDLKAAEAVAPMLDLLEELEPFGAFAQSIVEALGHLGADVVEPTLARLATLDDESDPIDYLDVLSRCGVQDARIYERLVDAFKQNPGDVAGLLARYGDAAAVGLLTKKLTSLRLSPGDGALEQALTVTEVAHAVVALGGELTDAQKEKLEAAAQTVLEANHAAEAHKALEEGGGQLAAKAARAHDHVHGQAHNHGPEKGHVHGPNCNHDHVADAPRVRTREKLGRNDPCWCESGKKYKKCHHDTDQSALY